MAGYNYGTVEDCVSYADITVAGDEAYAGGVAGYSDYYATVVSCVSYAYVTVTGNITSAGGVVGYNSSYASITKCIFCGSLETEGENACDGGIAGEHYGTILYCINSGTVIFTGTEDTGYTGGIAGGTGGDIYGSYSTGEIAGGMTGGIAGGAVNCEIVYCYYLDTTANAGVGEIVSGVSSSAEAKTSEQFVSGEVAWLLNGSTTDEAVWYQNLDNGETVDAYPVLDSSHGIVYAGKLDCGGTKLAYSNSELEDSTDAHEYDAYGFCEVCGAYQPALQNAEGVYEIGTPGQLFWFAALVNGDTNQDGITEAVPDACAILLDDIDLSETTAAHTSVEWTPIGVYGINNNLCYSGTFDGNGKTVSGLSIFCEEDYALRGLFGYVYSGTVENLTVSGSVTVIGETVYGGDIAAVNGGTISNCVSEVSVTVTGDQSLGGGLAGLSMGEISNCVSEVSVTVTGDQSIGGGVAGMNYRQISNCNVSADASVTGEGPTLIGGVAGVNSGLIQCCVFGGNLASEGKNESIDLYGAAGGIVGSNGGSIVNCANTGSVKLSSDYDYAGGVAGASNGYIYWCYNVGTVTGSFGGGIAGMNAGGEIVYCYYLNTTADTGIYEDQSSGIVIGENTGTYTVEAKIYEQFISGEVAWLLQSGQDDADTLVWGQSITGSDTDEYPVLTEDTAREVVKADFYLVTDGTAEDSPFAVRYTNNGAVLADYPDETSTAYTV